MLSTRITGDKALDRKLRGMPVRVQNKLEGQAIRAGLRIVVKRIKDRFPSKYRHLRTVVKSRYRRGKVAKAGAGVGKRKVPTRKHAHRGGVGLGSANIHWAVLSTSDRRTRDGAYRGRMPPILGDVVGSGWNVARHEAARAMLANLRKGIEREWKRL